MVKEPLSVEIYGRNNYKIMRICRTDKVEPGLKTMKYCSSREAPSPVSVV